MGRPRNVLTVRARRLALSRVDPFERGGARRAQCAPAAAYRDQSRYKVGACVP